MVTTYVVNLRHYLMAASLAPYFAHLSRGRLALLAHGITDESYALTMARFARQPAHPAYFAGSAAATYVAWYVGAAAGGVLGGRIPDPHRYGLDFVFPAVFIAILARTIQAPWQWAVAGVAAVVALAVKGAVGGTWHIARGRPRRVGARHLARAARRRSAARRRPGSPRPDGAAAMRPGLLLTFAAMGVGDLPDARAAAPRAGAAAAAGLGRAVLRGAPDRAAHGARAAAGPARAGGAGAPAWVTDLPAAVAVAVLARRTGHLLVAVAGGVVLAAALRALLG